MTRRSRYEDSAPLKGDSRSGMQTGAEQTSGHTFRFWAWSTPVVASSGGYVVMCGRSRWVPIVSQPAGEPPNS